MRVMRWYKSTIVIQMFTHVIIVAINTLSAKMIEKKNIDILSLNDSQ